MWAFLLGIINPVSSVFSKGFDYLNKRADVNLEKYKVDGQLDQKLVDADVELIKAQRDLILAQNPYRGYRYLHYLFGYPLGIYWVLILWTKVTEGTSALHDWSWDIPGLSSWQLAWASAIIGGLWIQSTIGGKWR